MFHLSGVTCKDNKLVTVNQFSYNIDLLLLESLASTEFYNLPPALAILGVNAVRINPCRVEEQMLHIKSQNDRANVRFAC